MPKGRLTGVTSLVNWRDGTTTFFLYLSGHAEPYSIYGFAQYFRIQTTPALGALLRDDSDARVHFAVLLTALARRSRYDQAQAEGKDHVCRGIAYWARPIDYCLIRNIIPEPPLLPFVGYQEEPMQDLFRVEVGGPTVIVGRRPQTPEEIEVFPVRNGLRDDIACGECECLSDIIYGEPHPADFEVDLVEETGVLGDSAEYGIRWDRVFDTMWDATQQFLCETGLRPGGMVEVTGNQVGDVSMAPDQDAAPQRGISFDIEATATPDPNYDGSFLFPDPTREDNQVIQISAVLFDPLTGQVDDRVVFCLGETAPIATGRIECFDTERALLRRWAEYLRQKNPDFLAGWNIDNSSHSFDMDFIVRRVQHHYSADAPDLLAWGSDGSTVCKYVKRDGDMQFTVPGLVIFCMYMWFRKNMGAEDSYKLDVVGEKYVGQKKDDVHHSKITPMWQSGDPAQRAVLADYCLQDSQIVLDLLVKFQAWTAVQQMAYVNGVTPQAILHRGQGVRVEQLLLRHGRELGYASNYLPKEGDAAYRDLDRGLTPRQLRLEALREAQEVVQTRTKGFQGATVVEPKVGLYHYVTVFDYRGLYPSIIRGYNICYTTMQLIRDSNGDPVFVCRTDREGMLPKILRLMTEARSRAKEEMKRASTPQERANADAMQNALKVTSNSIYGYTGARHSPFHVPEISAAITRMGRENLQICIDVIPPLCGPGAEVVYGDTDSVMIRVPGEHSPLEMFELGQAVEQEVNTPGKYWPGPIYLEHEKFYKKFFLSSKKHYMGNMYVAADQTEGTLDVKGMEAKRRDPPRLVREAAKEFAQMVIMSDSPTAVDDAVAYVQGRIYGVIHNTLPLEEFSASKKFNPPYAGPQPHAAVVDKMKDRKVNTYRVSTGDRVPFVITYTPGQPRNATASACAEDPDWAREHGRSPDAMYYLQGMIKPMVRLFRPLLLHLSDAEIVALLFKDLKFYRNPQRGIVSDRMSPELVQGVTGSATRLVGRRPKAAAAAAAADKRQPLIKSALFGKQNRKRE